MKSYTCWGYRNGKPWKMVNVMADNKENAEIIAWDKFKKMNLNPDYINCTY